MSARVRPNDGSMTYGIQRSFDVWSKYDRSVPDAFGVRLEVEVGAVRDAHELAPLAARELNWYSMSTVRLE